MDIKVVECKTEIKVTVLYIHWTKVDSNGTIISVYCYNRATKKSDWIDVKTISKQLLSGEVFAYAGKYDKDSHSFINVSIVIPLIRNGDYYITSITDDKKTNNLDYLPSITTNN